MASIKPQFDRRAEFIVVSIQFTATFLCTQHEVRYFPVYLLQRFHRLAGDRVGLLSYDLLQPHKKWTHLNFSSKSLMHLSHILLI